MGTSEDLRAGSPDRWRRAWSLSAFRTQLILSLPILAALLLILRLFVEYYVERRSGVVFNDPLLALLPSVDVHWLVYALTYSALLLGFCMLSFRPFALLLFVRASIVLLVLRFFCLWLLPLNPPAGLVPLSDPILPWSFTGVVLTRALFFSWHTALPVMFLLTAGTKDMKIIFSFVAVVVSLLLLFQHSQYSISLLAAPCFSIVAIALARPVTTGSAEVNIAGNH